MLLSAAQMPWLLWMGSPRVSCRAALPWLEPKLLWELRQGCMLQGTLERWLSVSEIASYSSASRPGSTFLEEFKTADVIVIA